MNKQDDAIFIDVGEWWYLFLFHWKKAFIFALVGFFLGSGIALLRYNQSESQYASYQDAETAYQSQKDQYEKYIAANEKSLSNYLDYYNNSILMQIDSQEEVRTYGKVHFTLMTDSSLEEAQNIVINGIFSDDFIQGLAEDRKTKAEYIKELISVESNDDGTLYVAVKGSKYDFTYNLFGRIKDEVKNISEENAGKFQCELVTHDTITTTDGDLSSRQSSYQTQITNAVNVIANAQSSLDDLTEPQVPDSLEDFMIDSCTAGVLLFILIDFLLILFRYIRKRPVYNKKDLPRSGKLKYLGSYDQAGLYKKKYRGITKFAVRKLGLITGEDPVETSSMVAVNLYNFASVNKAQNTILFIGEGDEADAIDKVIPAITKELETPQSEYHLIYAKNILTSPEARLLLGTADRAVIIIRKGVTSWGTVREEIRLLEEMRIECTGAVLL